MTKIYFANPGTIDPDVIRIMGVSVKPGVNPIGYFGTGLKYAIATLLRTGHKFSITTSYVYYEFTVETKKIRGEPFEIVFMNGEQLPFTLELGKNWTVDNAFRELYSNALDEGGKISDKPLNGDTVIIVEGEQITDSYYRRREIFLHSEPKYLLPRLEVHNGESRYLYYRGVQVYKLPKMSRFTYNLTGELRLTEDRTLASIFDAKYKIETVLPMVPEETFARKIIQFPESREEFYFESTFDFETCAVPSEQFLDAAEKALNDVTSNKSAGKLVREKRNIVEEMKYEIPTSEEAHTIIQACNMISVAPLNAIVHPKDVKLVNDLGPNILGVCKNNVIILPRQTLANGIHFTAITIYEEFIHRDLGYSDCTRGMQQYLFDKILQLIKEKQK